VEVSPDRQHAQHLLNRLAPDQVDAVVQLMEKMLDGVSRKLASAPFEDEEIGEEEEHSVARSKEWFKHNEGIPFEQVVADLGFTMDQIRNHRLDDEADPAA